MPTSFLRRAALAAAIALPLATTAAVAQEGPSEVVRETHGDWGIHCLGEECAMIQTIATEEGATVFVVSISKLPEPRTTDEGVVIVGVARILTPLNMLLQDGLALRIDDGPLRTAPFLVCSRNGCHSRPPLTADLVDELKAGGVAEFMTAVQTEEGRRVISWPISLQGFTAAFNAL